MSNQFPAERRGPALETGALVIADDHEVFRFGLAQVLRRSLRLADVLEAASFAGAIDRLEDERVVAAILDLDMPGLKRIQDLTLVRRKRPDIYLIVLSGSEDRDDILAALAAGAHGYIVKNVSTTSLVEQIKTILDGTIYVPACLARLPEDPATAPQSGDAAPMPPAITGLTERQNEVLRLIAQGLSNKRIAHALAISEGTVKMHVTSILRVTGASNRAQAAALGLRTAGETTT